MRGGHQSVSQMYWHYSGFCVGLIQRLLIVLLATVTLGIIPTTNLRASQEMELRLICELQGGGPVSPYIGEQVRTKGVVTADLDQHQKMGFYIQSNDCDHLDSTSDGIFVYLGERRGCGDERRSGGNHWRNR